MVTAEGYCTGNFQTFMNCLLKTGMKVQRFATLNKLVFYTAVFSVVTQRATPKPAFVYGGLRHDDKQAIFLKLGRGEMTGELSQSLPSRWELTCSQA